jgi:ribosomal protein L5
MEIPKLRKIIVSSQKVPFQHVKNASLALELLCSQKVSSILQEATELNFKYKRKDQKIRNFRSTDSQTNLTFISCHLYNQQMYNFLEKLITVLTVSSEYKVLFQEQNIQLFLTNREIRQFPEIQNHFDFFDLLQNIEVTLVTSAKSEKHTFLLWQGLQQKEI